jgi:hypothetical protein
VGLNEAQLINLQGTIKNMAAGNKYTRLIGEWTQYGGRVEFKDNGLVIRQNDEWLILYNDILVHIAPKLIAVKINGNHWHVSHAPSWRGRAVEMVKNVLANMPEKIRRQVLCALPSSLR